LTLSAATSRQETVRRERALHAGPNRPEGGCAATPPERPREPVEPPPAPPPVPGGITQSAKEKGYDTHRVM